MPGSSAYEVTAFSQADSATEMGRFSASPWQAKPARNYIFADNLRFLSMAAVVLLHCIGRSFSLAGLPSGSLAERCFTQLFKFATIGFFLVSGFLMGDSLTRRSPKEYLGRRLRRVFAPWLFWVLLFNGIMLVFVNSQFPLFSGSLSHSVLMVMEILHDSIFATAYWFVPNLMVALCVLLLCRRFLFDLRLGFVLMCASLFYGLNMYAHWVPVRDHTEALFGFIFYLWLGAWASRNFSALQTFMARIPSHFLLSLAGLVGLVALFESSVLMAAGAPYAMSTLRISNQAFSIVVALALFKVRRPLWPRWLNVRTSTFGIYLTHTIILFVIMNFGMREVFGNPIGPIAGSKTVTAAVLSLCSFFAIYAGALALTEWVLRFSRLQWTVGVSSPNGTVRAPKESTSCISLISD